MVKKDKARYYFLLKLIEDLAKEDSDLSASLLHNYILLCQLKTPKNVLTEDYRFKSYMRGAFSEQLKNDLTELYNNHFLDFTQNKFQVNNILIAQQLSDMEKDETIRDYLLNCLSCVKSHENSHEIYKELNHYLVHNNLGEEITLK